MTEEKGNNRVFLDGQKASLWVEQESKKLGLSVRKFCKKAGLSNSTVCRWKQGYNDPLPISIKKISSFIDKSNTEKICNVDVIK